MRRLIALLIAIITLIGGAWRAKERSVSDCTPVSAEITEEEASTPEAAAEDAVRPVSPLENCLATDARPCETKPETAGCAPWTEPVKKTETEPAKEIPDFLSSKKIAILHKVLEEGGEIHGYDVMKTKSSYRTLPLIPVVEEALLNQIKFREEMKKAFRNGYCPDYEDYICTDALGRLYRPDYVSEHFALLLKKSGLRHIRFHELRHSCASLLLAKKEPMKMIQEWLGHSDISTTSNIYSHLDAESKLESADIIGAALSS